MKTIITFVSLLMWTLLANAQIVKTIEIGCYNSDPYIVIGDSYTLMWTDDGSTIYDIYACYYIDNRFEYLIIEEGVSRADLLYSRPRYTWHATSFNGIVAPLKILILGFDTNNMEAFNKGKNQVFISPQMEMRSPDGVPILFGDLNNDGILDGCDDYVYDDIIWRKTTKPSERQISIADLDDDNIITSTDQILFENYISGFYVKGDLNNDNKLSTFDIILARKHVLWPDARLLKPYQILFGDINDDGVLSTFDILLMRNKILQK